MGNYISSLPKAVAVRTKRKIQELYAGDRDSQDKDEADSEMFAPRRKKLKSTSKYIYKTLYEDGQNSDVVIVALGVEWKLHKVYICQSPYFASMFSGAWKEANADEITIEIADPNVTVGALKIVLGSLYQDEIAVEVSQVVSVLGAAILFQLDGLIQQCCDIMMETTNVKTVVKYYDAAMEYGLQEIRDACFEWLLRNLLGFLPEYPNTFREVSLDLLVELISSPQLCVIQTEFSIYALLKMWVFLQENHTWEGTQSDCVLEAHKFFQNSKSDECFLDTNRGRQYTPAFQSLRLQHLVNHHLDIEMIETDNILPTDWLLPIFKSQWYRMMRVDQGVDKGPKQIEKEEFDRTSLRCGRILLTDTEHVWRWTGYHFGLDLVVTYERRIIKLRRMIQRGDHDQFHQANQQARRHICFRFTIGSLDDQMQLKSMATTELQSVSLGRNEEIRVMTVDRDATFPMILSANFVVVSPLEHEQTIPAQ